MERKLLVVVDMQNDFITGALGNERCEAIVPNVVDAIYNSMGEDYDVVFTLDTHYNNYLETQEGKKLPVKHCEEYTNGWRVEPSVENALKDAIGGWAFDRNYYMNACFKKNTFGCTELGEFVAENKYSEVKLIGVCTDICVISNAMLIKAFVPETKIIVDSSCCAGVTVESHERALKAMKACQIEVI